MTKKIKNSTRAVYGSYNCFDGYSPESIGVNSLAQWNETQQLEMLHSVLGVLFKSVRLRVFLCLKCSDSVSYSASLPETQYFLWKHSSWCLFFFFFSPSLLGSGQVDVFQGFFLMFFVFLFSKVERVEVIPRSNSTMKL